MKLAAGEVAGEKSIKTLAEVIDTLNQDPEIINRFGQKGLGQRNLGRAMPEVYPTFACQVLRHYPRRMYFSGTWVASLSGGAGSSAAMNKMFRGFCAAAAVTARNESAKRRIRSMGKVKR